MTEPTDTMEARVIELEGRLAHFEAMADELSSVVADQARAIDRLTVQLQAALGRLEEIAAKTPEPGDDQPPPHY